RFELVNAGSMTISYSQVTVRYWYTDVAPGGESPSCYSASQLTGGCAAITTKFVPLAGARQRADRYMEFGFTAGAGGLVPGKNSGGINFGIAKSSNKKFDTPDDYSASPAMLSTFTDWPTMTAYLDGVLAWGTEP